MGYLHVQIAFGGDDQALIRDYPGGDIGYMRRAWLHSKKGEAPHMSLPLNVERSIVVDKPVGPVYAYVADFRTWSEWSPWLSQDSESRVTVTGEPGKPGHKQSWEGEKVGAGQQELVKMVPERELDYDLLFIKPWKSRSKIGFRFEPRGKGTNVTWTMEGTLPTVMFFMKKKMSAMLGQDFERGLALLKGKLEAE
jgi:uncharacterized membrane protein